MKKAKQNVWNNVLPYSLVVPGVALLCILMFYPFLRNILYSFTNYKMTNPNYTYIGFHNYLEALTNQDFRNALANTFVWVVLNTVCMILIGVLGAFVMNSRQIRCAVILEAVLLLPWVLPEAITGYTWKLLLSYQSGIYYKLLYALHLIPENYDIFAHGMTAMLACVAANVWRSFPLISLTTLAKLRALPAERIEAAALDGANRLQMFFYIELPFIRPAILTVGVLCFIWTFNAYGIIGVMTNGGPAKATEVASVLMQKSAFQFYDYSMASTYAVLILLILVAVVAGLRSLPKLLSRRDNTNEEVPDVL